MVDNRRRVEGEIIGRGNLSSGYQPDFALLSRNPTGGRSKMKTGIKGRITSYFFPSAHFQVQGGRKMNKTKRTLNRKGSHQLSLLVTFLLCSVLKTNYSLLNYGRFN
ncbi:hypothetical protein ACFL6Y_09965 [Elusimicrobiota bacterium]